MKLEVLEAKPKTPEKKKAGRPKKNKETINSSESTLYAHIHLPEDNMDRTKEIKKEIKAQFEAGSTEEKEKTAKLSDLKETARWLESALRQAEVEYAAMFDSESVLSNWFNWFFKKSEDGSRPLDEEMREKIEHMKRELGFVQEQIKELETKY